MGVSAPALYRYFGSKKDLYVASLKAAGERLLGIWKRTIEQAGDPLDAVWTIGLGYYDHVRSRSPVVRLWFQAIGEAEDPDVRAALGASFTAAVDLLERNLEKGQAARSIRRDLDARVAAWHFMAIGLTFDLIHLLGREKELNRRKVEAWGRLYLETIAEQSGGASGHHPRGVARRAMPLRQPRRQNLR